MTFKKIPYQMAGVSMAAVNVELKDYQKAALGKFRRYLVRAVNEGADTAFYAETKRPFHQAHAVAEGTPYICLRVPTGGGKTLMAAQSIGIAAKAYLQTQAPMVLWLVPSTAILDQTLGALKDEDHPYRAALLAAFNRNFVVMDKAEALAMSKADATGGRWSSSRPSRAFGARMRRGARTPRA